MTNPYQVLGVSENASDDEIKSKYRELAKKYHPDNYTDTPMLEYASEKMKEINQAYDTIIEQRRMGVNGGASSQSRSYNNAYGAGAGTGNRNSQYADVRRMIQAGRLADAEQILDGVPNDRRTAEWFFLKGTVQLRKGWTDAAYQNIRTAHTMDPGNQEFAAAFNHVQAQRDGSFGGYNTTGRGVGNDCSCCDICCALWCMDSCCNCF